MNVTRNQITATSLESMCSSTLNTVILESAAIVLMLRNIINISHCVHFVRLNILYLMFIKAKINQDENCIHCYF